MVGSDSRVSKSWRKARAVPRRVTGVPELAQSMMCWWSRVPLLRMKVADGERCCLRVSIMWLRDECGASAVVGVRMKVLGWSLGSWQYFQPWSMDVS